MIFFNTYKRIDQKPSAPELAEEASENESNQDKTAGKKPKKRDLTIERTQ